MSTEPGHKPATQAGTDFGRTRRAILQSAATAIAAPAFLSAQGTNNETPEPHRAGSQCPRRGGLRY